jgi:hypothetical protein
MNYEIIGFKLSLIFFFFFLNRNDSVIFYCIESICTKEVIQAG